MKLKMLKAFRVFTILTVLFLVCGFVRVQKKFYDNKLLYLALDDSEVLVNTVGEARRHNLIDWLFITILNIVIAVDALYLFRYSDRLIREEVK